MDIAALSIESNSINTSNLIGTAVLKMSLDTIQTGSDAMIKMMEQSVNPNLGMNIDLRV